MSVGFHWRYLVLAALIFGIEVSIALHVHDAIIRPFFGDALVIVLLYCCLRTFVAGRPVELGMGVFLIGCVVEVLQYYDYVKLLHLEHHPVLSVVLGRTFSWLDFLAYFVGYLMILAGERLARR